MSVVDNLYVCMDCYVLISTGDLTYFDGVYDDKTAGERIHECESGIERIMEQYPYSVNLFEAKDSLDFSHFPCHCCQSKLAGERFEINVVSHK